jgi:hypothetical protein
VGVLIDLVWSARKHLQIANHVHHNKPDHEKTGDRRDPLSPDGGSNHGRDVAGHKFKTTKGFPFKMRPRRQSVKIRPYL